jgi:hypothetical protein
MQFALIAAAAAAQKGPITILVRKAGAPLKV